MGETGRSDAHVSMDCPVMPLDIRDILTLEGLSAVVSLTNVS